jgi:hypothetical protein
LPCVFDFFGVPSSALGRFLGRFGREDSPSPELLGACKSSDQLKAKGRLLSLLDRARDLPERREGDRVSSVFPESWRGSRDFRFSNLESSDFPEPWRGLRDFLFSNLEPSDFPEFWRGLRDFRFSNLESSDFPEFWRGLRDFRFSNLESSDFPEPWRGLRDLRFSNLESSDFPEPWRGLRDFLFSNLESSDFPESWRGLRDFLFSNLEPSDFPESWRGLRDLRDSNLESSALRFPEPAREDRVRPEFLELRRSEEFWLLRRCRRVGSEIRIPSKPSMVRRSIATPSFRSMSSMVRRSSSDTKV